MNGILETISAFVESERMRFSWEYNNVFALSVLQITRYRQFLEILVERHKKDSELYAFNSKALLNSRSNEEEHLSTWMKIEELTRPIHLDIESFYLFAKILLDKVAHFLEFYFGAARKLSFDSHDKVTKNLANYSALKNLNIPSEFFSTIEKLKKNISDHRDYQIAHEKSPRIGRATSLSREGKISIMSMQILPTNESSKQVQTRPLIELLAEIDAYLIKVIELVQANRDKTNLKLLAEGDA